MNFHLNIVDFCPWKLVVLCFAIDPNLALSAGVEGCSRPDAQGHIAFLANPILASGTAHFAALHDVRSVLSSW